MIVNIILILLLTITSLFSIIIGLGLLLQYGESWQLLSVETIDEETCRHYVCKNNHKAICYMIEDDIGVNDNIEKE